MSRGTYNCHDMWHDDMILRPETCRFLGHARILQHPGLMWDPMDDAWVLPTKRHGSCFFSPKKGNGRGKLWLVEVVQVESCVFHVSSCQACTKISAHPLTCGKCNECNESDGFWQKTVSLLVVSRYCACDQCSIEDPGSCWIRGSSGREGALDGWWLWL